MKNRFYFFIITFLLLTACAGYKTPSLSGEPSKMSGDTLCFRAAHDPANESLRAEIAARNLDCRAILENDPLLR